MFLMCPLPKLHKWIRSTEKEVGRALDKTYLQMKSPEPLARNQKNFTELVLMLSSSKIDLAEQHGYQSKK